MGYAVHFPMDPASRYDLLITRGTDVLKVQVKKAQWRKNAEGGNERLTVRTMPSGGRQRRAKAYKFGDYDLLAAIDGYRMWLVPYDELPVGLQWLALDVRGPSTKRKNAKSYDPSKWLVAP